MNAKKKKAVIDDGCCPWLVKDARFDGIFEIPIINRQEQIRIPSAIVPFSARERVDGKEKAIAFYEMDIEFADVLRNPQDFTEVFRKFDIVISPDCSLYRDMPFAMQITNTYRSRALGAYYQRQGCYVIPQIRWGDERSYTRKMFSEPLAFAGAPKESIVAIGTYGCIDGKENKYYFEAGLEAMLAELQPKVVLVYGRMPDKVFEKYTSRTKFVGYPDWTTFKKGGGC